MIGDQVKNLTPVYNFFLAPTKFVSRPTKKISFKCLICGKKSILMKPMILLKKLQKIQWTLSEIDKIFDDETPENFSFYNPLIIEILKENSSFLGVSDSDDSEQFVSEFSRKFSLNFIEIKIDSINVPRYSCAAHKLNICVRKALLDCESVANFFKDLSKFASSIIHSIRRSLVHRNKKSKLRIDNATRWGSSFLMLEAILKAFKRGVCNCNYFTFDIRVIEIYYQKLQTLYQFNVFIQSSDSKKADVIPILLLTVYGILERLNLEEETEAKNFVQRFQIVNKSHSQNPSFFGFWSMLTG